MILKDGILYRKSHNIFDIDGTLTYFENLEESIREALNQYGYDSNDEYVRLQFEAVDIILEKSINNENFFNMDNFVRIHKETMGLKDDAFLVVDRMLESTSKYIRAFPNVKETLEQLSCNLICSTNWFKKIQLEKLKTVGIEHFFKKIYTCEGLEAKPSDKHFRHILKKECLNPKDCVMIGDSTTDLGASQVGIETILVDYDQNKKHLYDNASAVITEFSDLKKILRR